MKTQKLFIKNKFHNGFIGLLFISLLYSSLTFGQTFYEGFKFKTALVESWKSEAWENSININNSFDSNDYLTNSITQSWENTAWVNTLKIDFNNNGNGIINQTIAQTWTTQWDNAQRTTFTYTASNEELTSITDIWFDPDWIPFTRTTKTYDGNGYLIKEVTENSNFISWNNSEQIIYSNNTNGTVNTETSQNWNLGTSQWDNTEKINYNYNGDKKVLSSTTQTWTAGSWVNSSADTNTYDSNGYLTSSLTQTWKTSDNIWVNDSKSIFSNNSDGTPHIILDQIWDDTGSIWVNSSRVTFTYNQLGINDFNSERIFTVYPNPVHDWMTINTNTKIEGLNYCIIDQIGRKCLTGKLNNFETSIDVNTLTKGIYFIQMENQDRNQTVKFIKK